VRFRQDINTATNVYSPAKDRQVIELEKSDHNAEGSNAATYVLFSAWYRQDVTTATYVSSAAQQQQDTER
jgi:hypothetical protein